MSNLLDKSSIVLTPTAYDNGKVLCVKPSDGSGDFDFSRNSAATRVNAQGLVEDVQILSSNLVQNGDFSEQGAEEVSNGSFSQQGSELVTNGDFSTDSNWNGVGSNGVDISNGSLNYSETPNGANITQASVVEIGKSYKVTFTISNYVKGGILVVLGAGGTTQEISANGTFTLYGVASINNTLYVQARGASGTTLSIDNVSVVEVGQNWDVNGGDYASFENNVLNSNNPQNGNWFAENVSQNISFVNGKTYKVTFKAKNISGHLNLRLTQGANIIFNNNITSSFVDYEVFYTANADNNALKIFCNDNVGQFEITNISFKEVGQDWVLGGNALISNSQAIVSSTSGDSWVLQNGLLVSGNSYKIIIDIQSVVLNGGFANFALGSGADANNYSITTDGILEFYFYNIVFSQNWVQVFTNGNASVIVNSISVVQITSDTNLPRINYEGFSYDGSGNIIPDSGCGSWLFEPQSTNLITQSELFSDSSWTKIGASVVSGFISPDGTSNAFKLVEDTSNGVHHIVSWVGTDGTFTQSIYAKKGERTWLIINIGGGADRYNYFDLLNGVVGNINGTTNQKMELLSNGWYKISFKIPSWSGGGKRMAIYTTTGNGVTSYLGDGTSGIYIWGAQLEEQTYSTSYIPTDGTSVTRNQDVCNNGGSVSTINSTEGVLYVEIAALADDGTNRIFSINDGSRNNRVYLQYTNASNTLAAVVKSSNNTQANMVLVLSDETNFIKVGFKYKANDFALWVNGVEVATDTSGLSPIGLNNLAFNDGTYNNFFGKTKALAVWKEALSDEELTLLTTI